jgi:hypothetical protein
VTAPGKGLDLVSVATQMLDVVVAQFEAAGHPLPDRRYVAPGDPGEVAWDCEQFVISLDGIGWGQAVDESQVSPRAGTPVSVMGLRHAVFSLSLVRCTPQPVARASLPTVEAVNEAGLIFLRDAGLLSQALLNISVELGRALRHEGNVQAGAVETAGPSGGYHGLQGSLAITVGALA